MSGERRLAIIARLLADGSPHIGTKRLCEVCAEVTGATGAGIMLMSGDTPRGSICTTGTVSARLEDLQFTLGEGPCVDAFRSDRPVLEPDLARPATLRWPAFRGPALDAGACAVFGFPLRVGAVRLGAMNLFRDRAGALDGEHHADALAMAEVAAEVVLLLQSGAPAEELASALDARSDFKTVVHQATGMVAAQLDVSATHALLRLRARAFADDRPLGDVAADVVARRLRFHPDDETGSGSETTP